MNKELLDVNLLSKRIETEQQMIPEKYQEMVCELESPITEETLARFRKVVRFFHASAGLATETGELFDDLKRFVFYGKELDNDHIIEELGDVLWYLTLAADEAGSSLTEVMDRNSKKLRARYGNSFSEEKALNRNIEKETAAMTKSIHTANAMCLCGGTEWCPLGPAQSFDPDAACLRCGKKYSEVKASKRKAEHDHRGLQPMVAYG